MAGEEERDWVYGVHPVLERIERHPGEVERIYVARERTSALGRLLRQARESGIPVSHVPRDVLARKLGARAVHQGIAAEVAARGYADLEALCQMAAAKPAGLLVALDGVQDAGNLGSILRTCAAAGVDGVILSRERTAGLTAAVAKASAGFVDVVPVARAERPSRCIQELSAEGFLTCGLDPRATVTWDQVDLRGRVVLVAGGEERGLRPGVLGACTRTVAIPIAKKVESLNVAIALGVLLFELVRQRRCGPDLETIPTRW